MTSEHFPGVIHLQKSAFPPPFDESLLWTAEDLQTHIDLLPETQWVAICEGEIVGSCSNTLISEENYLSHTDWDTTVGGSQLGRFEKAGTTLYGLDISVSERFRGKGIGRSFYEQRKQFVVKQGLKRYATGCRLPDFSGSGFENIYEYVEQVRLGRSFDRTLSPLLKYGLTIVGIHTNYMEDSESSNNAALLQWSPEEVSN